MRWVKVAAILSLWAFYFCLVGLCHVGITLLRLPNRWKIISRVARTFTFLVRAILGIRLTVVGKNAHVAEGGHVVIANHMSYVDGIILASLFPVVFVSKDEVKSWPVIGQWNALCGTIFVHRRRRELVGSLVGEMRKKLAGRANILLFPEGTSTEGDRLLPFQTAPLAAPLKNRSVIVPVTLTYRTIESQPLTPANRNRVYWYGDMDFLTHFWGLLSTRGLEATVTIQARIDCSRYPDNSSGRKKLAEECYRRVSAGMRSAPRGEPKAGAEWPAIFPLAGF
jgi:1-acyl-sn-glycerol-3-phosphate acyltransferase